MSKKIKVERVLLIIECVQRHSSMSPFAPIRYKSEEMNKNLINQLHAVSRRQRGRQWEPSVVKTLCFPPNYGDIAC